MSSFKKLAQFARLERKCWTNEDRNKLEPVLLEIAHAISRGRKPTSSSQLPGVNLQEWLKHMFFEIQEHVYDPTGDKCSFADELSDRMYYYWTFDDMTYNNKVLRAINICWNYIRPIAKASADRGDYEYQKTHKVTNLKRKREWQRLKNGSHYDEWYDTTSNYLEHA